MEPRPEYPRPRLTRPNWINLNGEWEFGAGERPVFDRRIVVPFCPQSELSGIGEAPGDTVWYRRRFDAPPGERLILHCGAVDYRATVWLNDVEVARHEGGHTPFSADITEALRSRDNTLVVRADDPLTDKTTPRGKQFWGETPEGIFYTPTSGIWQTVWLEPLPERTLEIVDLRPDAGAAECQRPCPQQHQRADHLGVGHRRVGVEGGREVGERHPQLSEPVLRLAAQHLHLRAAGAGTVGQLVQLGERGERGLADQHLFGAQHGIVLPADADA